MEIILTHEQADLDALASLLAASLLSHGAIPVLPNRINRNGRKFLNLYGSELSFVDLRDLAPGTIQNITLVDTQSLITLKGMNKSTSIHVIDHHQMKTDLPTGWKWNIQEVGATTTMLVEMLSEKQTQLSQIQSTLLLLGIYEDTGSLTYASTTTRDVRAVAFLLENNASLRIAAEYLNPALSNEQRLLAERLMQNSKTITVQGKSILIATADASEINEEISSVAHKLRDLLDPDALFLLVHTKEGVRLIARSTSDQINVSEILSTFGGGGHSRAAAALLTDKDSEVDINMDVLADKIINEIRQHILPTISVQKIMSKKPLLLTPETTIKEADQVMQRYGYEGYPVVQNGDVVGLLTRRAIDRARQHKLNLTAGSLMESGSHSLFPDQSLDHVRELMASTGWGQIPVLDPTTKKIIGIVTRTDLLKNLLGKDKPYTSVSNYGPMIEKALPSCRLSLLRLVMECSRQEKQALYIVGGFVRDLIMGIPSKDFDIVVEGDAIKFARLLAEQFGGRVVAHRRFRTAKWQIKEIHDDLLIKLGYSRQQLTDLPDSLDLISARTEFYDHPTALPTVESSSIKQDLHRRDFTINTLALRLDGSHFGELHDHWGGLNDLKKKQVKVLHSLSFVDDPTRMLRAVRFEQRFGFHIETRTLQLIQEARENLNQVSGDRIRHEFDLMFHEKHPEKMIARSMELGLLDAVHPGLRWDESWTRAVGQSLRELSSSPWDFTKTTGSGEPAITAAYLCWLSNLDLENGLAIAQRLHFSNATANALEKLIHLRLEVQLLKDLSPSQFTERMDNIPEIALYAFVCLNEVKEINQKIITYLTKWREFEPTVNGETLKSMGIPPGPLYAEILLKLKHARLDGIITDDNQERAYLEQLVQAH